jgi:glycosyltransferase involved in cell wall biosynthesis
MNKGEVKMSKKETISIIVPCFNEEEAIPVFHKEINKISKEMDYVDFEFIFVDDGSKDNTLRVLKGLQEEDKRVHYISFSKNFGKEAGMLAGLEKSKGDYVALMDVDLQDPPEMLKTMYHYLKEEDYDCCALYTKSHEGYSIIRRGLTNLWYRLITKLAKSKEKPGARDFRLMTRQMVNSILEYTEYNRYMKGIFDFVGYNTKWISYEAPNRKVGKSKFNIRKLIKYAIEGITSSSTAPLLMSTYIGLFFCLIAFIAIIVIIVKTIVYGDPVSGWPSLACIVLFLGGIQLFFLGVIGNYLAKIHLEVKNRPVYIIKEYK